MVTRRGFVGGAFAFGALGGPRFVAAMDGTKPVPPNLRFGVVSDVHIGNSKPDAVGQVEKAFRWFTSRNVDAVLCPGDIAHSGLISEMEKFAAIWYKVFPD